MARWPASDGAALRCIPAESQYAEMVRDMLAWHEKNPDDWQKMWQWIEEKYHSSPKYMHGLWPLTRPGGKGPKNIDAKLNGAYILMGLLYGKGDPDRTIVISMRCGRIEKTADGEEAFVIPVVAPRPSKLQRSWEPGPVANSLFTDEEKARITVP